jgi:hypothetical protein
MFLPLGAEPWPIAPGRAVAVEDYELAQRIKLEIEELQGDPSVEGPSGEPFSREVDVRTEDDFAGTSLRGMRAAMRVWLDPLASPEQQLQALELGQLSACNAALV